MTTVTEPGIFAATAEEYHADPLPEPSLSSSLIKELIAKTPMHAWVNSPRLNPDFEREEKSVFDIGHACHKVFTGQGPKIRVIDAPNFTTKDAKAQRDAAYEAGETPLLADQWDRVRDMAEAGRHQMRAMDCGDVFDGAECEVNFAARIDDVWTRCRADALDRENHVIYDFKSTAENPHPEAFARTMCNMGYDTQAAHYLETVEAVLGPGWRFRFVVQEKQPPHLLTVLELPPEWIDLAKRKTARARSIWRRCLDTGIWPGFPARVCLVSLPSWHENKWLDREIAEEQHRRNYGRDVLDEAFQFQAPLAAE